MTLRLHKRRGSIAEGDDIIVEKNERLTAVASSAWRSEKIGSSISAFTTLIIPVAIECTHFMYSVHSPTACTHCT
jgi:hypothetical protein